MSKLIVTQLAIYPVKSMRQVLLESAAIDMGGLKNDRRWMVVDNEGRMITQRQQSRLCLVQPALRDNGIQLSAAGIEDVQIDIPAGGVKRSVMVWNDRCNACDAGDEAAAWLSGFLKIECRLVYFPDEEIRAVDPAYASSGDCTAFSDGFPALLISQASLDDLNGRLDQAIPMARFRPNIVIGGCKPFAEDGWKCVKIGELIVRIVKPCSRCIIPGIDIDTAERGKEPARTLVGYRKRENKIYFGQNAVIDGEADIKTGMTVELIEQGQNYWFD